MIKISAVISTFLTLSLRIILEKIPVFFGPLPYVRIFSDRRNKHARPFLKPVQVTLVEVTPEKDIRLMIEIQSSRWRWNIGITQVCALSHFLRSHLQPTL